MADGTRGRADGAGRLAHPGRWHVAGPASRPQQFTSAADDGYTATDRGRDRHTTRL